MQRVIINSDLLYSNTSFAPLIYSVQNWSDILKILQQILQDFKVYLNILL